MKHILTLIFLLASLAACTPTVQVAAPQEPIEINLNVKIQHDIRIQVDDQLDDLFEEDDVF